jgi:hypothetical protein
VVRATFRRLRADGRHSLTVERDGLLFSMNPFTHKGLVPHDLGHLLAEEAFGIRHGIWGSIADGAIYRSMTLLEGRLRHDARARSAAVIKANMGDLGLGELLPGPILGAIQHDLDVANAYKGLAHCWGTFRTDPLPYGPSDVERAIGSFRRAADRWRSTPVGDALVFDWATNGRQGRRR